MLSYLKLIKFNNLVIIALAQICIKYGLLEPFDIQITLNGFGIGLLIISTFAIAASGNIIIEIYNQENSTKNELLLGSIPEKTANKLFILLNVIGVLIGFYLANLIGKPGFVGLFIIVSGIFYMYASYLKEIVILKNITISILMALSLIVIGVFDLIPAITDYNRTSHTIFFLIILDYAIFAFMITMLREMLKDCLTVDNDFNNGLKTIPVILGKKRTVKLISSLTIIPIIATIYYLYTYLFF